MMQRLDLVEFHTIVGSALHPGDLVLDLGANRGQFSRKITERFGVKPVLVEANPELAEDLQTKGLGDVHHLAISGSEGQLRFEAADRSVAGRVMEMSGDEAGDADHVVVDALGLEQFCAREGIDQIALIKMDIEGAEIDALAACSDDFLRRIPQMTIEFHDFCGLTPDAVVRDSLRRLESLGFTAFRMSRVGHQDCLLVQRDHIAMTDLEAAWIRFGFRNLKGAMRMVRKAVLGKKWRDNYA